MNAPLLPDAVMAAQSIDAPSSASGSPDGQCHLWQSAFGPMLIEVREGVAFVNGQRVLPLAELHEAGPGRAGLAR